MKNWLRALGLIFVLCCVTMMVLTVFSQEAKQITQSIQMSQSQQPPLPQAPKPHSPYDFWNLIFNGMTAVGTILVSLLAIFGQRIRTWLTRPRVALAVADSSPHTERIEETDESGAGGTRILYQIRVEAKNSGRETARSCILQCDKVFRERTGGAGFYILKKFVPKQFFWTSKDQAYNIVPDLPAYLNIAEISDPSQTVPATQTGTTTVSHNCLQILIEAEEVRGRFFRVENGKILIPIIMYADNIPRPQKQYIEIYWNGTCIGDFSPANFQLRLLSENQGDSMVRGLV